MSNQEWKVQVVCKNQSRQNTSFRRVQVAQGEVARYVMWYEAINGMSGKLACIGRQGETERIVQNNQYLNPIKIQSIKCWGNQM